MEDNKGWISRILTRTFTIRKKTFHVYVLMEFIAALIVCIGILSVLRLLMII